MTALILLAFLAAVPALVLLFGSLAEIGRRL